MDNGFELISSGMDDAVDMLSLDEMDNIIGGDVDCKKKYEKNGIRCQIRYIQTPTTVKCKKKYSSNGTDFQTA